MTVFVQSVRLEGQGQSVEEQPITVSCEQFLIKSNEWYVVIPAIVVIWIEFAANTVIPIFEGDNVSRRTLAQSEEDLDPRSFLPDQSCDHREPERPSETGHSRDRSKGKGGKRLSPGWLEPFRSKDCLGTTLSFY